MKLPNNINKIPLTRGTRIIINDEANIRRRIINAAYNQGNIQGFQEIIIPTIEPQEIYTDKMGQEILNQIYSFRDKSERNICLRPEGTATIQEIARKYIPKNTKEQIKLWYEARCFRYEKPQEGRYREFTQIGFEILGPKRDEDLTSLIELAKMIIVLSGLKEENFEIQQNVKRGLGYYTEEGFEISSPSLGAQKQVLGGGRYAEGIGFAIGLDRLCLAIMKQREDKSS